LHKSIATRLATTYALMLSVIVLFVIIASSLVLVSKLGALTGDVLIAKHEEARILVDQYKAQGMSLKQAAPRIVDQLSGIGLTIASCSAYRIMYGEMIACVSAGSNQVGGTETCIAQVSLPSGAAARAGRGMPARSPRALATSRSRRVIPCM